jgi:hypothetical protein
MTAEGSVLESRRKYQMGSDGDHKMGLIVPYRDRADHIKEFLPYMLAYLDKQSINTTVYVIEQESGRAFNRAKLLNIGVLEAETDCDYFVMHDVDMIPVDVDYSYAAAPTHLAAAASQFNYSIPFPQYFGGVTLFSREVLEAVNGYSNQYWGWGYEDTDMAFRCSSAGYSLQRRFPGRFESLSHEEVRDQNRYQNRDQFRAQQADKVFRNSDGLDTCQYSVIHRDEIEERVWLKVSL